MISTTTAIVNTLCTTGNTDFPANFKITDKAHVYVYYIDGDEEIPEELLTQVSSFTGGADNEYKIDSITETGFNVELRDAYDTFTGRKISIRRILPSTQLVDYPPGNDFPAATHERALDKLTAIIQQFEERIIRQIGVPLSEDASETSLLMPAYISNYYLGLNGSNELIWKVGTVAVGNNEIKDSHIDWGTDPEQVSAVDILIADAGGIITAEEAEGALQENRTLLNTGFVLTSKGLNSIVLTNYESTDLPAIAADSVCEIDGSLYTNPSEVAITGTTANTTWYDILLTPSGSTFTASFIARGTGVWSDSKHGLYSGNNRVVACAYRDSSVSDWINKNILIVNNRTIKIKMEIGDWNMDTTISANIPHGLTYTTIRSVKTIIIADSPGAWAGQNFLLDGFIDAASSNMNGGISTITSTNIQLTRLTGGFFDSVEFNLTSYHRGHNIIQYEV